MFMPNSLLYMIWRTNWCCFSQCKTACGWSKDSSVALISDRSGPSSKNRKGPVRSGNSASFWHRRSRSFFLNVASFTLFCFSLIYQINVWSFVPYNFVSCCIIRKLMCPWSLEIHTNLVDFGHETEKILSNVMITIFRFRGKSSICCNFYL